MQTMVVGRFWILIQIWGTVAAQDTTTTMPPALVVCRCGTEYATFLALINAALFVLSSSCLFFFFVCLPSSPSYTVVSVFRDGRAFIQSVVSMLVKCLMSDSIVVHGPPWAEITGSIYSFAGLGLSAEGICYQQVLHVPFSFFFLWFLNIMCCPPFFFDY